MSGIGKRILAVKERSAFTMVELLIVAIIIGVLIGVAIPRISRSFNTMQLNVFSGRLQSFLNYLRDRSVVEGKVLLFHIELDTKVSKKEYWAKAKDDKVKIKTVGIPDEIIVEADKVDTLFYPDGTIDKITIKITNRDKESVTLTTEGVFGEVKVK